MKFTVLLHTDDGQRFEYAKKHGQSRSGFLVEAARTAGWAPCIVDLVIALNIDMPARSKNNEATILIFEVEYGDSPNIHGHKQLLIR